MADSVDEGVKHSTTKDESDYEIGPPLISSKSEGKYTHQCLCNSQIPNVMIFLVSNMFVGSKFIKTQQHEADIVYRVFIIVIWQNTHNAHRQ